MRDRAASRAAIEALKAAETLRAYRLVLEQKPLPDFAPPPFSEPRSALPQDCLVQVTPTPRRGPALSSVRRSPDSADATSTADVLALGQPDWLYHELTVSGAEAEAIEFQRRARGPGIIPWQRDYTGLEEDLFLLLMRDRQDGWGLGSTSAHALAGRVGEFVERQELRAQTGRAPLDLHALVPVPAALLPLGPHDPSARAWLWQNWGTTKPLRRVTAFQRLRTAAGSEASAPRWRVAFWSADWSPWAAFRDLAMAWPGLTFRLRPVYELD